MSFFKLGLLLVLLISPATAHANEPVRVTHKGMVIQAVFSPDGDTLATCGWDKVIHLWDPKTGTERRQILGHEEAVYYVAFSPDGKTLASSSADRTIRFWDLASGQERRQLKGHTDGVCKVAFSPDGKKLASCGYDRTARVWEVATSAELFKVGPYRSTVYSVGFSPDGRFLATGSDAVRLCDAATGKELRTMQGGQTGFHQLAFSPDGRMLASGCDDHRVHLWEVASGHERRGFPGFTNGVWGVAFSTDGRFLAGGGSDNKVLVWDVATEKQVVEIGEHKMGVPAVNFDREGRLVTASHDGSVAVHNLSKLLSASASPAPSHLTDRELSQVWADLSNPDGSVVYRAILQLAADPVQAIGLVERKFKPLAAPRAEDVARAIKALDSDDFAAREEATRQLGRMGASAEVALRKAAVEGSVEVRKRAGELLERLENAGGTPERLLGIRIVEVLELAASSQARKYLEKLTSSEDADWLKAEAAGALHRLKLKR